MKPKDIKKEVPLFKEPDYGIDETAPSVKSGFFPVENLKKGISEFFGKFSRKPIAQIKKEEKATGAQVSEIVRLDDKTHDKSRREMMRGDRVDLEKLSKSNENEDLFSSPDTPEEAVSRSIDTLTNPKNIKHFTELSDNEIKALSALTAANKVLEIDVLQQFIDEFDNRRVSLRRQGRTELVDLGKAAFAPMSAQKGEGLLSKFVK